MYRSASVHMFDMLDRVHIAVRCDGWDGHPSGAPTERLEMTFDEQSIGAEDHLAWLAHALGSAYDSIRRLKDLPREQ